jgi:hypothetical protein
MGLALAITSSRGHLAEEYVHVSLNMGGHRDEYYGLPQYSASAVYSHEGGTEGDEGMHALDSGSHVAVR